IQERSTDAPRRVRRLPPAHVSTSRRCWALIARNQSRGAGVIDWTGFRLNSDRSTRMDSDPPILSIPAGGTVPLDLWQSSLDAIGQGLYQVWSLVTNDTSDSSIRDIRLVNSARGISERR